MPKRILDIVLASLGLLLTAPILLAASIAIYLQDFCSPFYIAPRVGKGGREFNMLKLRSMVIGADKLGGASTAATDARLTAIGRAVRRFKLDELPQLWNVMKGEMSLVGPRPNVRSEVALYTSEERRLLSLRPGITDIASIVFSDEGEILGRTEDPDLAYHQLIRPWKSRLGLLYVDQHCFPLDLALIALTALAIISRPRALAALAALLASINCDRRLRLLSLRQSPLFPYPPPGAQEIVSSWQ